MSRQRTPTEELARERSRARGYFWTWVLIATALSVCGNAAHAALTSAQLDSSAFRVFIGAVPPVMLAFAAEGVSLLYRHAPDKSVRPDDDTDQVSRTWVWWCAVAGAAALAAATFAVSYSALAQVAQSVHYRPSIAAVYPLSLDLSIAVGLVALVALPPVRARKRAPARPTAQPTASTAHTDDVRIAPATPRTSAPAPAVTDDHRARAERIACDGVVRKGTDDIAFVLALLDSGASISRAEREAGVHRDVVKKIRAADHVHDLRLVNA